MEHFRTVNTFLFLFYQIRGWPQESLAKQHRLNRVNEGGQRGHVRKLPERIEVAEADNDLREVVFQLRRVGQEDGSRLCVFVNLEKKVDQNIDSMNWI